jgi:uncharacterized protein (DUF1800 family)
MPATSRRDTGKTMVRRLLLPAGLAVCLLTFSPTLRGADESSASSGPSLTEDQKIVHVLNRLGYGARPGDVERVRAMGIDAYVRQQLHPETIDDKAADEAVDRLDAVKLSSSQLMDSFWKDVRNFLQMQMAAGNADEMKVRYGVDMSKARGAAGPATRPTTAPVDLSNPAKATKPPEENLDQVASHDAIRAVGELQQAKIMRAVLSERQLNEVLVDFWSNHFNIDVKKAPAHALKIADEREVIRPHVLGRFRDLLGASAHSPAMLFYLDNNENSVARERSMLEQKAIELYVGYKFGMSAQGLIPAKEGPNENYGREILELHTLGVDGGYTQKDVQEVARCFSGWTYSPFNGKFNFEANRHDKGQKVVLGQTIPAGGGIKDGEMVLDLLARHPSTAKFISRKLCQRFVSDEPPAELVERVAQVFRDTDGDLRKVVEAIVTSPEFFSPQAYRSKVKSPFEYAVSAVRATGGQFVEPASPLFTKVGAVAEGAGTMGYGSERLSSAKHKSLNWHIHEMGQPLFAHAAPNGYPEVSRQWVSPGALIDRLNFALALTDGGVTGIRADPAALVKGGDADQPAAVLEALTQSLLHGDVTPSTQKTLEKNGLPQDGQGTVNVAKLTALILGSPEFQRR